MVMYFKEVFDPVVGLSYTLSGISSCAILLISVESLTVSNALEKSNAKTTKWFVDSIEQIVW